MTIEELYFYHAWMNREFFRGKLEPVVFRLVSANDDDTRAEIYTELDPFLILFDADSVTEADTTDSKLLVCTMLLHEMVHQYNRERGVDDTDRYGIHLDTFKRTANTHGLTLGGYMLQEEASVRVTKIIDRWERAQKWKAEHF